MVMCMSKCCCLYLNSCGVYTSLHMLALTFPCTYKNTCHFVRTLLILHKLGFLCSFLEEYISKIRKYLDENYTKSLAHAFVSSKLDYCNALLIVLPKYQIDRLQSVLNTAARIIAFTCKYDHITPVVVRHWLPVSYRTRFKVLRLTYKALNDLSP